ncbi:hypothetical protein [Streptomyces sp. 7N604]
MPRRLFRLAFAGSAAMAAVLTLTAAAATPGDIGWDFTGPGVLDLV